MRLWNGGTAWSRTAVGEPERWREAGLISQAWSESGGLLEKGNPVFGSRFVQTWSGPYPLPTLPCTERILFTPMGRTRLKLLTTMIGNAPPYSSRGRPAIRYDQFVVARKMVVRSVEGLSW